VICVKLFCVEVKRSEVRYGCYLGQMYHYIMVTVLSHFFIFFWFYSVSFVCACCVVCASV
jgi:hypothetical protein